jgi:hypothetical protein
VSLCITLVAPTVYADPQFTMVPTGVVGGNRQWSVYVTPDPSLFSVSGPIDTPPNTLGGIIAVEMGFTVGVGSLVSVTQNTSNSPNSVPGTSPFPPPINSTQFGLVSSGNNIFGSLGTDFATTATPLQMLTITTAGSGLTTLNWLDTFNGKGRLAQGDHNFPNFAGSLTVPEPASELLASLGALAFITWRRKGLV